MTAAFVRRTAGALLRRRDGAAAVEMALVLPVLMLLVLGTMELGAMAWTQAALEFAVQEAARCAIVRPDLCGSPSQTASWAAQRVVGQTVPASAFTVTTAACGTQVRAQLAYRFKLIPIAPSAPTLTAQVCRS
jgi:Flp pilus assembly protein TadG